MVNLPTTHYYKVINNIQIHYIEKPGQLNTILFVHGRSMSVECWDKQFEDTKLASFRLIALDLPGHGLSEFSNDNIYNGIDGYTRILKEFIKELNLFDYILIGISLGGHVVLQTIPYLKGCKGILAMTMPVTKPINTYAMYYNTDVMSKAYDLTPSNVDVSNYISILFSAEPKQIPVFIKKDFDRADVRIHKSIFDGLSTGNYEDEIELINNSKIPIAIVIGTEDQIHNLSYLSNYHLTLWRDQYHLVPESGHLLNWENPIYVNGLIVEFMVDCFKMY